MDLACQQAEHAWLLPNGSARPAILEHLSLLEGVPESNAQLALVGGPHSQAALLLGEMSPRKVVHARAEGREKAGRPCLLVNLLTKQQPSLSPVPACPHCAAWHGVDCAGGQTR